MKYLHVDLSCQGKISFRLSAGKWDWHLMVVMDTMGQRSFFLAASLCDFRISLVLSLHRYEQPEVDLLIPTALRFVLYCHIILKGLFNLA